MFLLSSPSLGPEYSLEQKCVIDCSLECDHFIVSLNMKGSPPFFFILFVAFDKF